MKTILAMIALASFSAAPAFAQDPQKAPRPPATADAPMDMSKMSPEEMHRHCASMMGAQMQGRPKHDHGADKGSHKHGAHKPSEAEMKAMHDRCAAVMAKAKAK